MKRIVFDGPNGAKLYGVVHQAAIMFRSGKDRRDVHASVIEKLQAAGTPTAEATGNPDLVFYALAAVPVSVDIEVRERDLLLAAIEAVDWPGFALSKVKAAVALLENADRA